MLVLLVTNAIDAADDDFDFFPARRVTLESYTVVDLRASWQVNETWAVAARLENAFDEEYQTVLNYGTTGRAGYVSVSFEF